MSEQRQTTVFLVEDYDLLRDGLRLAIERDSEFKVVGEAADGLTAVHRVKNLNPDIVVMDIGLPQLDGISATQQIRQSCPASHVIMLTSYNDEEQIFAAFAAGAAGYCLKDVSGTNFALALRSVAGGAIWVDPRIADVVLRYLSSIRQGQPGAEEVSLSPRELDVLKLLVEGLGNKEIADRLSISISTVRTHIDHIMEKLSVSGRTQAAVKALKMGLV